MCSRRSVWWTSSWGPSEPVPPPRCGGQWAPLWGCRDQEGRGLQWAGRARPPPASAAAPCPCQGCMNNVTLGNAHMGYYETVAGGAGAGPGWHGRSGVHSHMTNTRITDPEVLESR